MRNLYICERPYPLYRTIVKGVLEEGQHDLFLSNHVEGMERMLKPLRESGLFRKIYFFNDIGYLNFYKYGSLDEFLKFPKGIFKLCKKFSYYKKLQRGAKKLKLPEKLDVTMYDDIYVNDAVSSMTLYLFHKKKKFVCVEHAANAFQKGVIHPFSCFLLWLTGCLEKVGLCYGLYGTSKYVKAIEVSSARNLVSFIRNKEIREVNLNKILNKLSEGEKDKIFEIYKKAYQLTLLEGKKVSVLLTQPLDADGLVPDKNRQVQIYHKIIEEHMGDVDVVLIKPHPRDTVDYKNFTENSLVVHPSVSAEILNLSSSLYFEKAVTINSTTINSFTKAKERIMLGEKYVKHWRG